MTAPDQLVRRAEELGVQTGYHDVHGTWHDAEADVLEALVDLLAPDAADNSVVEPVVVIPVSSIPVRAAIDDVELVLSDGTRAEATVDADRRSVVLVDPLPIGCHTLRVSTASGDGTCTIVVPPQQMSVAEGLRRSAGVFVPAYALWDHDQPLASFGLLARVARHLGDLGTELLTTLPLYAAFLDEPFDPSPYAPASRFHWNELYLDDDILPGAPVPDLGPTVDWAALGRRRREQLLTAVDQLDDGTIAAVEAFVTARPDVAAFARFMGYRVARVPVSERERVVRSHELAQFLADRQLSNLAENHGASLAIDLPIGCHPDGYERWAHPDLFVPDRTCIGAPPDLFFDQGQNWGLPPQLPGAGRRSGHRLWRDLVARAGEHADLLRIDHVMAVHRLWWIPDGFEAHRGAYVRYPRHEIMATIAATAAEVRTTVVGEDLGTVPTEVSEVLHEWGMLGMYEEQFHTDDDPMRPIPARTVSGIRTHDMKPFAAFVRDEGESLAAYRRRLGAELGREVASDYVDVLDAVLDRLSRSEAEVVTVDLDDLIGIPDAHNVPGTVSDANWRRRLPAAVSDLFDHPDLRRRIASFADRGEAG